jgi:hypothetical protein
MLRIQPHRRPNGVKDKFATPDNPAYLAGWSAAAGVRLAGMPEDQDYSKPARRRPSR